jgi:hypothetical protein
MYVKWSLVPFDAKESAIPNREWIGAPVCG